MARRPALTDGSFLSHIFSPKKNPLPTGIRHRKIVSTKGRVKARVNAYNKMPAKNQEVLARTGQRDAYLRGETTLVQARSKLRETAIKLGVAKPVKSRGGKRVDTRTQDRKLTELAVLQWGVKNLTVNDRADFRGSANVETMSRMIPFMTDAQLDEVITPGFTVGRWRYYASQAQARMAGWSDDKKADKYITVDDQGNPLSPYFYH
jgi:hypothetical protein